MLAVIVKDAHFDFCGVGGEDGEIGPGAIPDGPDGMRAALLNAVSPDLDHANGGAEFMEE
ncbi:MAG TPA: hypothetical protein VKE70_11845 [Candidatus Solibacter sp.]|nr:hypothetical protein [Candidatus Solibacter sp.]